MGEAGSWEGFWEKHIGSLKGYLERVAATFQAVTVETSLTVGSPAHVILEEASAHESTLVAMATQGRTGLGRWLLGSVADKVVHAATVPVLLVRGTQELPTQGDAHFSRVVLALDGSPESEMAQDSAAEMARSLQLPLQVVRVVPPTAVYDLSSGIASVEVDDQLLEDVARYLEEKERQLRAQGVTNVSSVILRGFPGSALVDLGMGDRQSIFVMSTHGRSGVGRWLLGSVTDRVVRESGNSVLVVRARRA